MSLIRQVWLMLAGVLLLAMLGSVVTHTLTAQRSLQVQLQLRNDDGATLLALALSQQKGDLALMQQLATARLDTGHYRHLRLRADDGRVLFEREWSAPGSDTPEWFAALLPLATRAGVAQVSDGTRRVGVVEVSSQAAWAIDELWASCVALTAWLAAIGAVAAALAAIVIRRWKRALDATIEQAEALQERRYIVARESRVPELQRLTRSMNALVHRMQSVLDAQAAQLEALQTQVQLDATTGLLARRAFVARFERSRAARPGGRGAVLFVRLCRVQALNDRIGREATDRLLAAIAQVLQSYPAQARGALAGRLNAADFALYLPATGVAVETGAALAEALQAALTLIDRDVDVRIGAVEIDGGTSTSAALAAADEALARAECAGPFAVDTAVGAAAMTLGEGQWRARLSGALDAGRAELAEFALCGPEGELLHLECPMRLQLEPGGAYLPAAQWLPMANRCKLSGKVDLAAIELALAAIHADGVPRGVNVAAASLSTPGFGDEVSRRLEAAPQQAQALWIDVGEAAAMGDAASLRTVGAQWRRLGVRLGIEHGGAALRSAARLHELGLDYVKLDRAFLGGVGHDAPTRELVRGMITLLHGMQLQVFAEGVDDAADVEALWALGIDGATGAAVASQPRQKAATPMS